MAFNVILYLSICVNRFLLAHLCRSFTISYVCFVGLNLRICRSNLTCCSQQMEYELYASSSRILEVALQRQTNATLQFLKTRASQFDGKCQKSSVCSKSNRANAQLNNLNSDNVSILTNFHHEVDFHHICVQCELCI